MNLSRIVAKEMAKGNCKIEKGNILEGITPSIEWQKWLSYEPDFEKNRIEYLETKKESELSHEETNELNFYRRNKFFADMFKLYNTKKCNLSEYMLVYDFMSNESIEKIMLSKLTNEELEYAKKEINRLNEIPEKELSIKVNEGKNLAVYEKLSIVDSYILHVIANIDFVRCNENLNNEINSQIEENNVMRQRSLYNSLNI